MQKNIKIDRKKEKIKKHNFYQKSQCFFDLEVINNQKNNKIKYSQKYGKIL